MLSLTSALALVSHFKVLRQSFFYVMGKVLLGELSCTGTGLVCIEMSAQSVQAMSRLIKTTVSAAFVKHALLPQNKFLR